MRMREETEPDDSLNLTLYIPDQESIDAGEKPVFMAHLDTGDGTTERFFEIDCMDVWREDENKEAFYAIADWLEGWSQSLREEAMKRWGPDDGARPVNDPAKHDENA